MSESELPVVEVRTLWSVSFRKHGEDDDSWVDQGMPTADAAAVLRTLDYLREKYPETENRVLRTDVVISVENEKLLREKVGRASAGEKGAVVQSE